MYITMFWNAGFANVSPSLPCIVLEDCFLIAVSIKIPTKRSTTPVHANGPPTITPAGVIVGGPFAWTGVVLLFVGILIDTAIRKQSSSTMHGNDGETLANPAFQNMVMYMMLPVFVLLQLALAWRVYGYMTGMPVEVTSMIWGVIPFTSGITGL